MTIYNAIRDLWIADVAFLNGAHRCVIVLAGTYTDAYEIVKRGLEYDLGLEGLLLESIARSISVAIPSNPAPNPILWVSPEAWPNAPAG
jgi:hypothetical protein